MSSFDLDLVILLTSCGIFDWFLPNPGMRLENVLLVVIAFVVCVDVVAVFLDAPSASYSFSIRNRVRSLFHRKEEKC